MEFLVLLFLAVVLVGLGLAFLHKAREKNNQAHCANNLRIIGSGMFHFQGGIPIGFLDDIAGPPLPPARIAPGYASWTVLLAPYIDEKNPLAQWDLEKTYLQQSEKIRQAVFPYYLCPGRSRAYLLSTRGDGKENVAGFVGDYAAASGDGDPKYPWDSEKANGSIILGEVLKKEGDRILRWQSRVDFASLTRGLSNTILVGDKYVPVQGLGKADFGDGSIYNGGNPSSSCRVGGPGHRLARSADDPFLNNFGGIHPGLCQFLMADDSLRIIDNEISETVLGALIRRE